MVKCVVCGKAATEDIGMCTRCISEAKKKAESMTMAQQEAERILNDIETVAELTEGTTTESAKRATEALMKIMNRLRRAKREEKQKSKAEEEKEVQQEQTAKEIAED